MEVVHSGLQSFVLPTEPPHPCLPARPVMSSEVRLLNHIDGDACNVVRCAAVLFLSCRTCWIGFAIAPASPLATFPGRHGDAALFAIPSCQFRSNFTHVRVVSQEQDPAVPGRPEQRDHIPGASYLRHLHAGCAGGDVVWDSFAEIQGARLVVHVRRQWRSSARHEFAADVRGCLNFSNQPRCSLIFSCSTSFHSISAAPKLSKVCHFLKAPRDAVLHSLEDLTCHVMCGAFPCGAESLRSLTPVGSTIAGDSTLGSTQPISRLLRDCIVPEVRGPTAVRLQSFQAGCCALRPASRACAPHPRAPRAMVQIASLCIPRCFSA